MTVSLEEILNQMPEEERAEVFRRADEIRQQISLREVRRLRGEVGRAMFLEDIAREAFGDLCRVSRDRVNA